MNFILICDNITKTKLNHKKAFSGGFPCCQGRLKGEEFQLDDSDRPPRLFVNIPRGLSQISVRSRSIFSYIVHDNRLFPRTTTAPLEGAVNCCSSMGDLRTITFLKYY